MTWSPLAAIALAAGRDRIRQRRVAASKPRPFRVTASGNITALAHRSTKHAGEWQVTLFDSDGEPFADTCRESFADLVIDGMWGWGIDWSTVEWMGAER